MVDMPRYLAYEERAFAQARPGRRERDVPGLLAKGVTLERILGYLPSPYPWERTRELERRTEAGRDEGVWPINHSRVHRYYGDPGRQVCEYHTQPETWPDNVHDLAKHFRLHHYFRVWSGEECRELLAKGVPEVRVALEVTEEWHSPPGGFVEPHPESLILGSHAVPVTGFDAVNRRFTFQNSWGPDWGDGWFGSFSPETFDRYVLESWCLVGVGLEPPLKAKTGVVCLLWKSDLDGREVHGREIVDAATGERLAWSFLVRRGEHLDIEEFFVWQTHRRKGYARKLAELIQELVVGSRLRLRAWVPFADAERANRPALLRLLELLQLHLGPSPHRSAAFLATKERAAGLVAEPRIPERPASVRERLSPESGTRLYTVWFGTNRRPVNLANPASGFSEQRSDQVHYGTCKVSIPRSHRFGSVGSSWWQRWIRWTDDRLVVQDRTPLSEGSFWQSLSSAITANGPAEKQALVFIHGYNVTFDAAAIRAAQMGFDLKFPGVTAFFSWPSFGTLTGYPADEAAIEASEAAIATFLREIAARSGAERIHLIAHSMGNRGLLRALHRIERTVSSDTPVRFGQIILAAPDIDQQVFRDLADVFPRLSDRTTLYVSRSDRAVSASAWLHSFPRVGLTPPVVVVPSIDTIEVPSFDVFDLLGHSYYAEAEGLLHDIFSLIRHNLAPSDRLRLNRADHDGGLCYWVMNP